MILDHWHHMDYTIEDDEKTGGMIFGLEFVNTDTEHLTADRATGCMQDHLDRLARRIRRRYGDEYAERLDVSRAFALSGREASGPIGSYAVLPCSPSRGTCHEILTAYLFDVGARINIADKTSGRPMTIKLPRSIGWPSPCRRLLGLKGTGIPRRSPLVGA